MTKKTLKEFSVSELVARPAEVLRIARESGAILTRHRKQDLVIIPLVEYRHLTRLKSEQKRQKDIHEP